LKIPAGLRTPRLRIEELAERMRDEMHRLDERLDQRAAALVAIDPLPRLAV